MRRIETASNTSWGQTNWQALTPLFGEDLAQAARDGFKAFWETWQPPLPFKRGGDNTIENGVIVGLTGLAIAAEEGFKFQHISAEKTEIATRYAFREINGFPDWFEDVAISHPEVVHSMVERQIAAEMSAEMGAPNPGNVLSSVRYGSSAIRDFNANTILDQLAKGDPPQAKILGDALEIVMSADADAQERLPALSHTRLMALNFFSVFSALQTSSSPLMKAWAVAFAMDRFPSLAEVLGGARLDPPNARRRSATA